MGTYIFEMDKRYLIEQVNPKYSKYLSERRRAGCTSFAFRGGRRSGKTFFIAQFLTTRAYNGEMVNVASMTQTQGRLGAYDDFKTIIQDHPTFNSVFDCLQSPLEIRNKANGGKIIFNSYTKGMTAKGIACDWLFVNEANAFDKLQVANLRANVRKGWIIDYNPDVQDFWAEDLFAEDDICKSTWKDNPFLTPAQLEWFEELRKRGTAENASALDKWLYRVYYLGEYSELSGSIFTADNIHKTDELPPLMQLAIFCDPSDLRGADHFACVLAGIGADGKMYVIDAFSPNEGQDSLMIEHLRKWCVEYNVERIWIETNGSIGMRFYELAINEGLDVSRWYSKGDKFERIVANYQDLTNRVVFANTENVREFLTQVYTFDKRCAHDDNIDAVNSLWNYYRFSRLV